MATLKQIALKEKELAKCAKNYRKAMKDWQCGKGSWFQIEQAEKNWKQCSHSLNQLRLERYGF